ncbi:MAG: T9SS type A sorting domain-containing protein [Ferruginibacter sp.]
MKTSISCLLLPAFVFATAPTKAQQLYIKPNSNLVLNGNIALVLKDAALNNNGTIIPTTSTVHFGGYADTTVSNITGSSRTTLTNLSINKQAYGTAVKSRVDITNTLNMISGNLYPDSALTLKSTAANTAMVTAVPANCHIPGKTIIERYIPSRRAWRLLTVPAGNTNTIYNTWQNGGVYAPATGMYVTGPGPTGCNGNGLDTSLQNNTSMKKWDAATQTLQPVTNTHVPISPGIAGSGDNIAYFTFVRGDRTFSNFTTINSNITTLTSSGVLQTGAQSFTAASNAGGYSLVGNPYASPVDFNSLTRNNIQKRFYVWDPALNTLGGYVMLDDLDNDGSYTKSVNASSQNRHIQSGQGFFVQTVTGAAASVTFGENAKSSTNNNVIFRPAANTMQSLRVTLNIPGDDGNILADETLAEFDDSFSDAVNLDDALKFGNINEEIAFLRRGRAMTAERRPRILITDTLFLKLNKTTSRNYQFVIKPANLQESGLAGFLEDNYLHTVTELLFTGESIYNFTVTADAASTGTNRFRIIFKQGFQTLPVSFTSVNAYRNNADITVEWNVSEEMNIEKYEVERSADGNKFETAGVVTATGNDHSTVLYNFIDENPAAGDNFYRIKSIDRSGTVHYSKVVKVNTVSKETSISIYPNPVTGNTVNVQFINQPAGKYNLQLLNNTGQVIEVSTVFVSGSYMVYSMQLKNGLPEGTYQLQVNSPADIKTVKKVMIQ